MTEPVIVVGHKNPDNDSICSAIAYAHLKNELLARSDSAASKLDNFLDGDLPRTALKHAELSYIPARLGALPPETEAMLKKYHVDAPLAIAHVHARVADVMTSNPLAIQHSASILEAGRLLRQYKVKSLIVTNDDGSYRGLITTRMIAERYIAATDLMGTDNANTRAVADDLIKSLEQKVEDIMETDVLVLDKEVLLKDAIDDLMASALREAVVLDDRGFCRGIVTRSDVATRPKRKVILVDHNETRQAALGIEEAEIIEIIDHHRIADISTSKPITFINLAVGSTATIVTMEFRKCAIQIPCPIAALLLSAIMTDTIILKSPTTTAIDKDQACYLADILSVSLHDFGLQVFSYKATQDDVAIEDLIESDAKEFQLGDCVVLIAQHETTNRKAVLAREHEIRTYLQKLLADNHYEFVLFMLTDIVAEGSHFFCEGNRGMLNRVFGIHCTGTNGTWMPGILSRKKQVAAKILG